MIDESDGPGVIDEAGDMAPLFQRLDQAVDGRLRCHVQSDTQLVVGWWDAGTFYVIPY